MPSTSDPPTSDPSSPAATGSPPATPPRGARGAPGTDADAPEPASRQGLPALQVIRPLAVLAVIAVLVGRMVAPAMVGLTVGMDRSVHLVEMVGAGLSQLLAMGAVVTSMALIGATARGRSPIALRIGAVVAGSIVILVALHATVRRVPDLSAALIGVCAALLAIAAAWDARRAPFARPAAAALGLIGVGALVRLLGVFLAVRAAGSPALGTAARGVATAARGVATAAFVADALAILVATVALAARPRGASLQPSADEPPVPLGETRPLRLASPATIAALAAALVAARQALAGGGDDAGASSVLFRRALEALVTRPAPFVPLGIQLFVAALAVSVALVTLIAPPELPALAGAVALVLVARSAPEIPLNALALVIAALSIALAARDDRGFWAAVLARDPARPARSSSIAPKPAPPEVRQVDADNDNR